MVRNIYKTQLLQLLSKLGIKTAQENLTLFGILRHAMRVDLKRESRFKESP